MILFRNQELQGLHQGQAASSCCPTWTLHKLPGALAIQACLSLSLTLSHCRCRGPWHEKPFLQIYMCSNHSINNWSGGYPFSRLEVSGLPCLVSLIWAMRTLGPCNLTISESEWMSYRLYRVYLCLCLTNTDVWNMDLSHDVVRISVVIADAWCYAA